MKTAIEHLQAEFNKWAEGRVFIPQDLLEEAKRLEKEQIMNAHTEGYSNYDSEMTSIDYFNQTYNN